MTTQRSDKLVLEGKLDRVAIAPGSEELHVAGYPVEVTIHARGTAELPLVPGEIVRVTVERVTPASVDAPDLPDVP
ncbi:MAG TPA: hypothetical protein VF881_17145 [Polyangiaceae bacterium]